eukprot:764027-Hanusia_phi.AAC.7
MAKEPMCTRLEMFTRERLRTGERVKHAHASVLILDRFKHGFGIFKSSNGARYEGQWVGGKKHGQGTYTSNQGSASVGGKVYRGLWRDDKPCDAPDMASGANNKHTAHEKTDGDAKKNYFGFFQARGNAAQNGKQSAEAPEDEQTRVKREQEEAAERSLALLPCCL